MIPLKIVHRNICKKYIQTLTIWKTQKFRNFFNFKIWWENFWNLNLYEKIITLFTPSDSEINLENDPSKNDFIFSSHHIHKNSITICINLWAFVIIGGRDAKRVATSLCSKIVVIVSKILCSPENENETEWKNLNNHWKSVSIQFWQHWRKTHQNRTLHLDRYLKVF